MRIEKESWIGRAVPKLDGPERASGRAIYIQDLALPRMLHGAILRSERVHARILSIDTTAAERLFRHKILHLLKNKGLLSDERIEILNAFRRSGFSVDGSVTVWPQGTQGLVRLASYLLRCPVSLSRIHWIPGSKTLFYESNGSSEDPLLSHPNGETLDVFEFIARVPF